MSSSDYDRDYYENGPDTGKSLYKDYRWLPEMTLPFCHELIVNLGIEKTSRVLDVGCAKGFYVKGLRMLGIDAYGVDISAYAIDHSHPDAREFLTRVDRLQDYRAPHSYHWILAKDVLEHIPYSEIDEVLEKLRELSINLFAIIPLARRGKYIIESHEDDPTHHIRESAEWWEKKLKEAKFPFVRSVCHLDHMKERYRGTAGGTGFFRTGPSI